jgi:hypothetical protein
LARLLLAAALLAGGSALACDFPDEGGNFAWRRAVSKVRYLPAVEAWAIERTRDGGAVQYVVLLDSPRHARGRCWWPVEVRADGTTWQRYLVTPDGKAVRKDASAAR